MIKYFLILSTLLVLGCDKTVEKKKISVPVNKEKEAFLKSAYFDEARIKNDKYEVKSNGDSRSYSELELYYSYNKSKKHELIPYSLIMVEKHKNYDYCDNLFNNLLEFYSEIELSDFYNGEKSSLIKYLKNIELLNKYQRDYAIYFLELGAKNKNIGCISDLEMINRYGLGVNKNLKKADSLKIVYEKITDLESKNIK
ncbi:hypothetical protein [Flavobacterium terrigena]|uniref:Lipoprotein n=1 Tax=Flavobacterium terrigena TaxID=402734 RepID=A0A1H6X5K7_9FLAO|nr:hypothetical protein [Flavobacterium terrigena]SEJ20132.1 hypothetical protein SAMN05660918_2625 [Flavobacterium terrigena]